MSGVCYKQLVPRDFVSGAKTTAKSFKSWDTCMDNKACKIIAIVGIVLAVIVGVWIVGSLLLCFKYGASGICEFCCWCCCSDRRRERAAARQQQQNQHQQHFMGGAGAPPAVVYQPVAAPQGAYYRGDSYYNERGSDKSVAEVEQDFDLEAQKKKHWRKQDREAVPLVYDEDTREEHELSVYHPAFAAAL